MALKLHLKKNALHKSLGVKKGNKIPKKDLTIKKTDSPLMKKRKLFAKTAAKWKK